MSKPQTNLTAKLTESALFIALATVLSLIKLLDLPYGGSITACSMLPVMFIGYRHGTAWGIISGLVYSVIQLLLGLSSLSYATSATAAVAIIMLDYILAFTVLGFSGIFKNKFKSGAVSLPIAAVILCVIRYLFHLISGCTVWAGISIPTAEAFIYSLAYNATYMLPEAIITVIGAVYITRAIDFDSDTIKRVKAVKSNTSKSVLKIVANTALAASLITDVVFIAAKLQNADTGDFYIAGITDVNWIAVAIVTVSGLAIFGICKLITSLNNKKAN